MTKLLDPENPDILDALEDALRGEIEDAIDPEDLRRIARVSALYLAAVRAGGTDDAIRARQDLDAFLEIVKARREIQLSRTVWVVVGVLERFLLRALTVL